MRQLCYTLARTGICVSRRRPRKEPAAGYLAATTGSRRSTVPGCDYTIKGGTGILAGATGSGDIVADHGIDKWHGTLDAVGLHPKQSSSTSAPLVISSVAAGVVLIGGAIAVVVVRRRGPTAEARAE